MELDVVREDLRDALAQPNHPSQIVVRIDVLEAVLDRLDAIERRARQVRGGLKPYARPVEIVDFLMGEQP